MGNNRTQPAAEEGLKYNRARVTNTTQGERQIQKGRGLQIQGRRDSYKALENEIYCKQNGSPGEKFSVSKLQLADEPLPPAGGEIFSVQPPQSILKSSSFVLIICSFVLPRIN